MGMLIVGSEVLLSAPECYTARIAPAVPWSIQRPSDVTGCLGVVNLCPHMKQLMGMPGAGAVASCPQTGTVCLNCIATKSWQAWNDIIEKKAVTSDSSSGIAAAATMHLPADEGCPFTHVLCL